MRQKPAQKFHRQQHLRLRAVTLTSQAPAFSSCRSRCLACTEVRVPLPCEAPSRISKLLRTSILTPPADCANSSLISIRCLTSHPNLKRSANRISSSPDGQLPPRDSGNFNMENIQAGEFTLRPFFALHCQAQPPLYDNSGESSRVIFTSSRWAFITLRISRYADGDSSRMARSRRRSKMTSRS